MNEITQIINTMGFPIACCVGLGWFIYTSNNQNREDNIRREEKLLDQLSQINIANKEIVETNRILAQSLEDKINGIDCKLDTLISKEV